MYQDLLRDEDILGRMGRSSVADTSVSPALIHSSIMNNKYSRAGCNAHDDAEAEVYSGSISNGTLFQDPTSPKFS